MNGKCQYFKSIIGESVVNEGLLCFKSFHSPTQLVILRNPHLAVQ